VCVCVGVVCVAFMLCWRGGGNGYSIRPFACCQGRCLSMRTRAAVGDAAACRPSSTCLFQMRGLILHDVQAMLPHTERKSQLS